jgi:hypothetical protein
MLAALRGRAVPYRPDTAQDPPFWPSRLVLLLLIVTARQRPSYSLTVTFGKDRSRAARNSISTSAAHLLNGQRANLRTSQDVPLSRVNSNRRSGDGQKRFRRRALREIDIQAHCDTVSGPGRQHLCIIAEESARLWLTYRHVDQFTLYRCSMLFRPRGYGFQHRRACVASEGGLSASQI